MEHRKIGELSVSAVGLGCNNFGRRLDAEGTRAVVDAALESGVNFFDTADVYGGGDSERYLGGALKGRRHDAVIATKFGAPGSAPDGLARGSREWIQRAVDASLSRLGVDTIDLYQMHFPDPDVDIADTLGALQDLVKAGKIREIGASNFSRRRVLEAADTADARGFTPCRSLQNRFSLLHREPEEKGVLDACAERGLGFIPYFPLESGLLTGKVSAGQPPPPGTRLAGMDAKQAERFLSDERVEAAMHLRGFAEEHGASLLQLAFAWLLGSTAVVSVIAGATRPEQVRANVDAASWTLSDTMRDELVGQLS